MLYLSSSTKLRDDFPRFGDCLAPDGSSLNPGGACTPSLPSLLQLFSIGERYENVKENPHLKLSISSIIAERAFSGSIFPNAVNRKYIPFKMNSPIYISLSGYFTTVASNP